MHPILIADSGSSKTDWILISSRGAVLAAFESQGLNPFFQTSELIASILHREVFPRIPDTPANIYFYGAGCTDDQAAKPVRECLEKAYSSAAVTVASDLLGAARSICQHQPGIACILGTGSNNCLYDGRTITGNIGSLGFWMGDEGSGGHLGKQLVVNYLHNDLPADLQALFSRQFPGTDRLHVLDKAYKQPFPNRYFATFTRFIGEHQSHPYLQELLRSSFDLFLTKYVLKFPDARQYPVGFTGSVAWHFRGLLTDVLEANRLQPGSITQRPLPRLVAYHLNAP